MLFIFIVPSLLASCLLHALPCMTMHCAPTAESHTSGTLCPVQNSPLSPGLLQEERWATPSTHPSAPGQWASLLTTEQRFVGALRSKGLPACRLSLQPCRHKLLICSHLHRIAAADGASKLVAVADSYMPRVKYVSSTHHYFFCHHSCQFRPCLD